MKTKRSRAAGEVAMYERSNAPSAGEVRRRRAAARAAHRRRAFVVVLCGLLGVIAAAVVMSPALYVRAVQVEGLANLTADEADITAASAARVLPPGTNWALVPSTRIEQGLSRLPWVASAQVARGRFGCVRVTVRPRVPVAVLNAAATTWELDAGGRVVRAARPGVALPNVEVTGALELAPGVAVTDASIVGALSAVREFSGGSPVGVSKIVVDHRGELCLNMKDTVAIRLGQPDDLSAKIALTHRIYNAEPRIGQDVATIDLSCPDAPACRPRGATDAPGQEPEPEPLERRQGAGRGAGGEPETSAE